MSMLSKFTTKIQYKRDMKKMSKQMVACRNSFEKNEKRIQELQTLIQADAKA